MQSSNSGCSLVIGGTGGIGRAIVEKIATSGEPIFFTYMNREEKAREIASEIRDKGGVIAYRHCDLTDRNSIHNCLNDAIQNFTKVRSVIYSSGLCIDQKYLAKLDVDKFREAINVDVLGFFNLVQVILPQLRDVPNASIVAITTAAIRRYLEKDGLSTVPKAAVEEMCRALAKEEGPFGIRVNCVAPGFVEAGIGKQFIEQLYTPEVWEGQKQRVPLKRFCQASEIAEVAFFLASPLASYVTGQSVAVDGGFSV